MAIKKLSFWDILMKAGLISDIFGNLATADQNADGKIDTKELQDVASKVLPKGMVLFGARIQDNDALDTPEEQEQCIQELGTWLRKWKFIR